MRTDENYTVKFITNAGGDIYSGMWWQPIGLMLKTNFSRVSNLEGVTFLTVGQADTRLMTTNWLDMNVEHLSKYLKHFESWPAHEDATRRVRLRISSILEEYVTVTSLKSDHHADIDTESAVSRTVAILPLKSPQASAGDRFTLVVLEVAATAASLWNVGVGRIVVSGVSDDELAAYNEMRKLLEPHVRRRPVQLSYVQMGNASAREKKNVPRLAMVQFQRIVRMQSQGSESVSTAREEIASWLGLGPSSYKHIYFSEPDLILHIGPKAMRGLSAKLDAGCTLLGAHRLSLMPHLAQFRSIYDSLDSASAKRWMDTQLLPQLGSFGAVHELDTSAGDVCCDQGTFYPSNLEEPRRPVRARLDFHCPGNWDHCGFAKLMGSNGTWAQVVRGHHLVEMYPFISQSSGTRVPLLHAHQRVCLPKRGPDVSCP